MESESAPYFGVDSEELHLLRKLHSACKADAMDGVSEDVMQILHELSKTKKKKKN